MTRKHKLTRFISMKTRRDAVVKDEKVNRDQRDAMLEGTSVWSAVRFQVADDGATEEVRERIRARHAAEQVEQKKQPRQSEIGDCGLVRRSTGPLYLLPAVL